MIVAVSLVTIDREQRKETNHLHTLAQNVWYRDVIRFIIIRIKSENASCKRIHHIMAWSFHNDITYKTGRQGAVIREQTCKFS